MTRTRKNTNPSTVDEAVEALTPSGREFMIAVTGFDFFDDGYVEQSGNWGENMATQFSYSTGRSPKSASGIMNGTKRLGLWETGLNDGMMWWALTELGAGVVRLLSGVDAQGRKVSGEEPTEEQVETCPACGEPTDYCSGHGPIGDPEGYAILQAAYSEDDNLAEQAEEQPVEEQPVEEATENETPKPLTKTEAYEMVKYARLGLRQADDRIYLGTHYEVRAALFLAIQGAQKLLDILDDRGINGLEKVDLI